MTREEFHSQLRVLLHDTADGYSVDETFYLEKEIIRAAMECRRKVFEDCVNSGRHLTVFRSLRRRTATDGTNVPGHFWKPVIGMTSTGKWVNVETIKVAEALIEQGLDCLYVKAGKFYGTAATAMVWEMPASEMTPSLAEFFDFPDSFYHAVMTLTARELIMKEASDVAPRISALDALYERQFASLR